MRGLAIILAVAAVSVGCATPPPDGGSTSASTSVSASASASKPEAAPATPGAIDCTQADGEGEKAVCADPELRALDTRLAELYQRALSESGSDTATLETEQRGWVAGRDDCWKESDVHQCVLEAYQTRLVELQIKDVDVPATVEYRCGDNTTPVSAVFYNDIDPSAMVLTVGRDRAILIQQPTGSGIRYVREGAEYAEHQGDIAIDFYGTTLTCTAAE